MDGEGRLDQSLSQQPTPLAAPVAVPGLAIGESLACSGERRGGCIYLLTGDEDFYQRFARPSLEYLLSRPGPHFAAEREIWDNYYHHQPMRGPGPFFGASTFASADAMTQVGANDSAAGTITSVRGQVG